MQDNDAIQPSEFDPKNARAEMHVYCDKNHIWDENWWDIGEFDRYAAPPLCRTCSAFLTHDYANRLEAVAEAARAVHRGYISDDVDIDTYSVIFQEMVDALDVLTTQAMGKGDGQ